MRTNDWQLEMAGSHFFDKLYAVFEVYNNFQSDGAII